MYQTINKDWLNVFFAELNNSKEIKIVSPFINDVMVNHLLSNISKKTEIHVVTRYNLNDFLSGVSSLNALKKLVRGGAKVRGVLGLHSKVYIFDQKSVILTSANFTSGGFFNNHEFGILSHDPKTISESSAYFKFLETIDPYILTEKQIAAWQTEMDARQIDTAAMTSLKDYGRRTVPLMNRKRNYFIKFFGSGDDRVNLDYSVREMIKDSHCHYALTFSGLKGRPRKYRDNDIVYIARILHGTDYAIVGRAIAYSHLDSRDVASDEDIAAMPWRADWPIYIRIHSPVFIKGTMEHCPKMKQLIDELLYDCFDKTSDRHKQSPDLYINPWDSLKRQADVQLSDIGAQWLEMKFEDAISQYGKIPKAFLKKLYTPVVGGL